MENRVPRYGIRPNPMGDWPKIDSTAFVDPSAQIIGNVQLGPNVFVGPQVVIRADEPDPDGRVHPIVVGAETNLQDGVIIHSRGGTSVIIGPEISIAHGVVIHGPCDIGRGCFLSLRSVFYRAILEEDVWVGIGAIVMKATIPSHTMIPAGSLIRSKTDVRHFRLVNIKEEEYQKGVAEASRAFRQGYLDLYEKDSPAGDND